MHEAMQTLESQTVFSGPVFSLADEQLQLATGKLVHHFTIRHPGAVVILPRQDDGTLLLIKQYRHSVGITLLEFPAGTLEAGEEPLTCAKRELAEETGYLATQWQALGHLYPAPGFCSEVQYCFFASGLAPGVAHPDADECIEVVSMSTAEVDQAIRAGRLSDGKSIALYTRANLHGLLAVRP